MLALEKCMGSAMGAQELKIWSGKGLGIRGIHLIPGWRLHLKPSEMAGCEQKGHETEVQAGNQTG